MNKLLFTSDRAPVPNQRDGSIQVYLGESMSLGVMCRNLGDFQVLHHQKAYPSTGMTQKATALELSARVSNSTSLSRLQQLSAQVA